MFGRSRFAQDERARAESGHRRVLVVCTGNICRSPFIAAVLAVALPGLDVSSAGVTALTGEPPAAEIQGLFADRGLTVAETDRAAQLTRSMVRSSSLIITATRLHRVEVVRLDRSAVTRAFTLKELARVLVDAPAGLGVAGAAEYVAQRADDGIDHDDDLDDPYGLDRDAYRTMAEQVDAALTTIIPVVATGRAD